MSTSWMRGLLCTVVFGCAIVGYSASSKPAGYRAIVGLQFGEKYPPRQLAAVYNHMGPEDHLPIMLSSAVRQKIGASLTQSEKQLLYGSNSSLSEDDFWRLSVKVEYQRQSTSRGFAVSARHVDLQAAKLMADRYADAIVDHYVELSRRRITMAREWAEERLRDGSLGKILEAQLRARAYDESSITMESMGILKTEAVVVSPPR